MELESQVETLRKRGLEVAALSYDPLPVLGDFATRRNITFPLLSDPDSAIIRRFGLLDPQYPVGDQAHGVPHPTTFIVDEKGIVVTKLSDEGYVTRRTAASILAHEGQDAFPGQELSGEHVRVRTFLSNPFASPGNRITLVLTLELDKGLHAYAPGTKGYRALVFHLEPQPLLSYAETVYPPSHPYVFRPLHETVAVFADRVRLLRDVTLAGGKEMGELLRSPEPSLTIRGSLDYQVCSDSVCFPPRTLPLTWSLSVLPLDRERSAEKRKTP